MHKRRGKLLARPSTCQPAPCSLALWLSIRADRGLRRSATRVLWVALAVSLRSVMNSRRLIRSTRRRWSRSASGIVNPSVLVEGAYPVGYVATSTFPPSLPCVGGQHLPNFGL